MNSVIEKLNDQKLIRVILSKGRALELIKLLKDEKGIVTANVNNARGVGRITPLAFRGVGEQAEKEILSVVVDSKDADDIFEYIFYQADINKPHGGLMYMSYLDFATPYMLPDIPEER